MLSLKPILVVSLFLVAPFVSAHKEPKTPEEIEIQRALQAAAYYVRSLALLSFPFCLTFWNDSVLPQ